MRQSARAIGIRIRRLHYVSVGAIHQQQASRPHDRSRATHQPGLPAFLMWAVNAVYSILLASHVLTAQPLLTDIQRNACFSACQQVGVWPR